MHRLIHQTDDLGGISNEVVFDGLICFSTVFTSTVANNLKETLEEIIDDPFDNPESSLVCTKWMESGSMSDNYEDDLEMGGPGLAAETAEGTPIPAGTIQEGYITRYLARKFSLKLMITEEAIEDSKYPQVLSAAKRLKRALYKTMDIDMTNILVRATNTAFVGGDGLPLASNAHTIPGGGTFSNTMAVPMAPSVLALTVATTQTRLYPGHDGITEGNEPKKVVFPTPQWALWDVILKSTGAPDPGEFNAINVANQSLDITPVPIKYWSNTTTNWALITDADNGVNYRWRRRPRSRTWIDNDQEIMNYGISARWSRGWSDPRGVLFVDA